MGFHPMRWAPELPELPEASINDFMFDERYGRYSVSESLDPYIDGLTGRRISATRQIEEVDHLARSLLLEFGWQVNTENELDKVVGIFAYNTIDIMTLNWAILRLNGVPSPANAAYSVEELQYQLVSSGAQALFTVEPLLHTALEAAKRAGIPSSRVYVCEMPGSKGVSGPHKSLSRLISDGEFLPEVEPVDWSPGQSERQVAFLCYSSGTSGLPKGVKISHKNVIVNIIQISLFDRRQRTARNSRYTDVVLALLPMSHIYSLICITHLSTWRGDSCVVLPKFDITTFLESISTYKVNSLCLVPPIIITMVKNNDLLRMYDLRSVHTIYTGAAPLGQETAEQISQQYPNWTIRQGYGMTETCTAVTSTEPNDVVFGSSGCLLSGIEIKIMNSEDVEITDYDVPGELLVKSPSVVLGYLNNPKADAETFIVLPEGRFIRTGDVAVVKKSASGNEHIWIVDRIKELIKVKGLQVAPAELEAHILDHSAVADCAVIPVQDDLAGEVPKAYVVKSPTTQMSEDSIRQELIQSVAKHKAHHKWLKGGVEFVKSIPKSPSGKILRREIKAYEKALIRERKPKL